MKTESKRESIWRKKICYGMPLYVYLILTILVLIATFTKNLPNNMVGATAFLLLVGGGLTYIGDRIPVWKDWLGGGLIFALVVGALLAYFHILPQESYETIKSFYYKPTNMLVWCIAALIAGSILSMPRAYLVKALPRYFPTIFGGLVFAYLFAYIGGVLTGYGGVRAILFIANPIEGGGLGAGAIPMSEIYAKATGMEFDKIFSMIIPAVVLGNVIAIFTAAVLDRIGRIKPKLSGNGVLIPKEMWMPKGGIKEVKVEFTSETVIQGWAVACTLMVAGYLLSKIAPIHYFAWMIILTIIIKILKIFPPEVEQSAAHFYKFIATGFYGPLLLGVGLVHFKLDVLVETFTPTYFLLTLLVVIGAALGAGIFGRLVGLYPIESAICGGLCMANMGGSGDIAVLAASKRMELMPYAQISSRIGGAIMLLIAQAMAAAWSSYLVG